MNPAIEDYVQALSRKLWLKKDPKHETLQEIRSHLEVLDRAEGPLTPPLIQDRLGSPAQLAGAINRSVGIDKTQLPTSLEFIVAGGYALLNIILWYVVQRTSGWIHGLSAPATSAVILALYGVGTIALIGLGCALAARWQCPRLMIYLIAVCPAAYHLIFQTLTVGVALVGGKLSWGDGMSRLASSFPQTLILGIGGVMIALGILRSYRYPKEEWRFQE